MNRIFVQLLIISCFAFNFLSIETKAQEKQSSNLLIIESRVEDPAGNPVSGAIVYSSHRTTSSKTDADGKFSLRVPADAMLTIEADGFSPIIVRNVSVLGNNIVLTRSQYLYGVNDKVNIPFGQVKKGDIVGAVRVINPREIQEYDNTHQITDALTARVPGLLGTSNIRGLGGALILVDGIPRSFHNINLEEIEQITVLKDVNSIALYGSQAKNGVILITTRRGEANKNTIRVTSDYGTRAAKAFPEYLGSADYMTYYNEARVNDGLSAIYDETTISNFRNGNAFRYPDIDYFSNDYIRKYANSANTIVTFSGGSEEAVYFTSLGWTNSGSLINFGEALNDRNDRFNIRGNIEFKVNDFITSYVSTSGIFDLSRSGRTNYWQSAADLKPHQFTPLIPIDLIDDTNEDLVNMVEARKNDVDGKYLIGGNIEFLDHPFGRIHKSGYNNFVRRTFQFDNNVNFDFDQWVEGLSFQTNVGFDMYSSYNQFYNNNYSVYQAVWDPVEDLVTDLIKYGEDTRSGDQNIGSTDFTRAFGFYGKLDYNRTFGGAHNLNGILLGYGNTISNPGQIQPDNSSHLALGLAYSYRYKYMVNINGAYPNSVKLPGGNKVGFAPTLGAAWIISSEDFLSGVAVIDYLKIKTSAGIINSDTGIGGYYYYNNVYRRAGNYQWADGAWSNRAFRSNFGANRNLFFERRKEINLGLEGSFFNQFLYVDLNVFSNVFSDMVDKPTTLYPGYYSDFVGNENFNKNGYRGGELGISLSRSLGDFSFTLNSNLMYVTTEVLRLNEIYANAYQYRQGKPVHAIFGLESDGFFIDQTDIDNHAFQAFGEVQPGDIKYIDQNGDNIIDGDDRVEIGLSQPPFSYGLSLNLKYRNLRLFVLGHGRRGATAMKRGDYYWVDGDSKYSSVVLNRWTEETKNTATYPRLSSVANNNNFQNSNFWLYSTDYFYLDRMQLTWDLPDKTTRRLALNNLSLFVNGSGLLRISENKDILDLNVGSEPQYRYYSVGANIGF
jgi:TonB-linked SusC/RagA family outer membrane protein